MLTTSQQELAVAWDALATWAMYVLMPQGLEQVALAPMARHVRASEWLIRREARSDEPRRRQLAAMLAGRMARTATSAVPVDPDLLGELFEIEVRRVREQPREDVVSARAGMIESAGVVSQIVDAACLWAMRSDLRQPALEVLRRILEAALAGEAWTNLERAALVLARRGGREDWALLSRLHRMLDASGEPAGAAHIVRALTGESEPGEEDEASLLFGERATQEFVVAGEAGEVLSRAVEAAQEFERTG